MSVIDYVTISITRSSMPEGHLCRIDYTYHLNADRAAYLELERFRVACELCGKTLFGTKRIGRELFDVHDIAARDAMPVHRSFMIECDCLDERVGEDAIFIKLHVHGDKGEHFLAESAVVHDYF